MPSAFVPFLSGNKSAGSGHTTTLHRKGDTAVTAAGFAALVPANSALGPACNKGDAPKAQPTVSLQKDGDRVTHIRIECSCGEIIELECSY